MVGSSPRASVIVLLQATMVASWVVELYLDHINRAMLEETPEASTSGQQHEQALRDFLRDHVDVLDVNVTIGLLASYGRLDDLMHYATYRQVRLFPPAQENLVGHLFYRMSALRPMKLGLATTEATS